jgi:tripartite-type tricarboxylate transporter receptor subunit TctC
MTVSYGLLAPAGTPEPIVTRLHDDVVKILADQSLRTKLTEQGYDLLPPTPPSGYTEQIKADLAKWVPIVKASGAAVD